MTRTAGETLTLQVVAQDRPGVLSALTEVIFRHGANIDEISTMRSHPGYSGTYLELNGAFDKEGLLADLTGLAGMELAVVPSFRAIFGARVIVVGGGAQVGMVAQGAIAEADRHNIRGERISVDTIPLVGEERLAAAVRAVARLHRAEILVLAGALMGGDISTAVREVRAEGIIVVSLRMAGSVPEAADLVVSDPLQAGVMAVMLIAKTAKFSIEKARGKVF
jgi:energy-converting hydrogenase B subunit Q